MEIGAGSGQEACGRATQNASNIEKVEEKIDGCSAQEAEIEPPAKTRLEPKKPSKGLGGREALGSRERLWKGAFEILGGGIFKKAVTPLKRSGGRVFGRWLVRHLSGEAAAGPGAGSGRPWQARP